MPWLRGEARQAKDRHYTRITLHREITKAALPRGMMYSNKVPKRRRWGTKGIQN